MGRNRAYQGGKPRIFISEAFPMIAYDGTRIMSLRVDFLDKDGQLLCVKRLRIFRYHRTSQLESGSRCFMRMMHRNCLSLINPDLSMGSNQHFGDGPWKSRTDDGRRTGEYQTAEYQSSDFLDKAQMSKKLPGRKFRMDHVWRICNDGKKRAVRI